MEKKQKAAAASKIDDVKATSSTHIYSLKGEGSQQQEQGNGVEQEQRRVEETNSDRSRGDEL
jgi:hypothetical protein